MGFLKRDCGQLYGAAGLRTICSMDLEGASKPFLPLFRKSASVPPERSRPDAGGAIGEERRPHHGDLAPGERGGQSDPEDREAARQRTRLSLLAHLRA